MSTQIIQSQEWWLHWAWDLSHTGWWLVGIQSRHSDQSISEESCDAFYVFLIGHLEHWGLPFTLAGVQEDVDKPSLEVKFDSKQFLISRLVTGPGGDNGANRGLGLHAWHGRGFSQRSAITHDTHSELPTSDLAQWPPKLGPRLR